MQIKSQFPFGSITAKGWQNIGLAVLAAYYAIQIGLNVMWGNLCGQLAIDFCAYWSAGNIASEYGYAEIYDLTKLELIQQSISPAGPDVNGQFATTPVPYLPVFMLPFQFLSYMDVGLAFWLWTFINLSALIFYLIFFIKSTSRQPLETRLLIILLLSLPVYLNIYVGQVNVWMTVCIGEFIRASLNFKLFRAGLWLGGLLLKPQFLILIGLALILQRSVELILGLFTASIAVIGISYWMIGQQGFITLMHLWLGYTSGLPTNDVEIMMNWRMVGLNLSTYLGPIIAWTIAGVGMLATILLTLWMWRKPIPNSSTPYFVALLGTFAAIGVVAWHSHTHSNLILIPPLIYLYYNSSEITANKLMPFIFIPPAFHFLVFILAALIQTGQLTNNLNVVLNIMTSISVFGINLFIVYWSFTRVQMPKKPKLFLQV